MVSKDSIGRRSKLEPKSPKDAADQLAEAWTGVMEARRHLDKAHEAIGLNSKWAGQISWMHRNLYRCQEYLEEIVDEIKERERSKRQGVTR